jgi:hypothetical protein
MKKKMVTYIARSLGTAMAVVYANKGGTLAGLDLALILDYLVGLDYGEGELAYGVLFEVPGP